MKNYTRCLSSALTLLLLLNTTSYAWNSHGHMMVAAVAYQKLTLAKKNRVEALLALNPARDDLLALLPAGTPVAKQRMFLFMLMATWSDRIKSDPDFVTDGTHNGNRPPVDASGMPLPSASQNIGFDDLFRHKYWHFVDLPFTTDGSPLPTLPVPNAQTQLAMFMTTLIAPTSRANSDALKSFDLTWLLHLVGDVHQPLHCTTRANSATPDGDDGGNGVKISGAPHNLHSFWDGVLGGGESPVTAASAIATLAAADATAANDLDVSHWIDESFQAAKTTVYKNPPIGAGAGPFTLSASYRTAARKLAEKRIALAGARLANFINNKLQ